MRLFDGRGCVGPHRRDDASARAAVGLLFVAMAFLGMGVGVGFQLVPQREGASASSTGASARPVAGRFMLPSLLGAIRDYTGSYAPGLFGCAAVFLCGLVLLLELGARWSQRWDVTAAKRAGVVLLPRVAFRADDESPA